MDFQSIKRRMIPVRKLRYGQTPWDNLAPEEMIYLLQSYHRAAEGAHNVFWQLECGGQTWWGSAKSAVDEVRAAVESVFSGKPRKRDEEGERFYRSVMRPVQGLEAFSTPDEEWHICDGCGDMGGFRTNEVPPERMRHTTRRCAPDRSNCSLRKATWEDWRAWKDRPAEEAS